MESPGKKSIMEKMNRGIASTSITSFGSFMIPKPILRTKGRALRAQLVLFIIEVFFTVSTILGGWLMFNLPNHGATQLFYMTSTLSSPSKDPNKPNDIVRVLIVPQPAQLCCYASIGLASVGLFLTLIVTYSSKIPESFVKYILGICVLLSIGLFFLQIASHAGFEANINQIATVVSLTGSLNGVDYSGRGYGYASLVISWILAIPLVILSNTVLFGHLRGVWEHNWRETLRASWGQGIPDWLQQAANASAYSPVKSVAEEPVVRIDTELKLATAIKG